MVQITENGGGITNWTRAAVRRLVPRQTGNGDVGAQIEALTGALNKLADERQTAQAAIAAVAERRRSLLLEDAPDEAITALGAETERHRLALERLDLAEPSLVDELTALRSRQRGDRLAGFLEQARTQRQRVLARAEEAFAAIDRYRELWTEAASMGFERQMPPVPDVISRDMVGQIKAELDGQPVVASPQPPPAPAGERKPLPHEPVGHGSFRPSSGSGRGPPRELYRDGPPGAGERQVVVLRSGYTSPDNRTCTTGDRVNLRSEIAEAAAKAGAVELLQPEEVN